MLEHMDCQVSEAEDGTQALEKFPKADLMLLDITMPDMDGFECIARLRAQESEGRLPVVALTAHALPGFQQLCLEAGMDGYLSKPITSEKLRQTLARFASEQSLVVDLQAVLHRIQGDEQVLNLVVEQFLELSPSQLQAVIEAEDPESLRVAAHTLKGSLLNFGAMEAARTASQLEDMGREGRLKDSRKALMAQLKDQCDQVRNCLLEAPAGR